jgi:predicted Zn-dependent peptidase
VNRDEIATIISSLPLTNDAQNALIRKMESLEENSEAFIQFTHQIKIMQDWSDWMKLEADILYFYQHFDELITKERETILKYITEHKDKYDEIQLQSLRESLDSV